MSGYNDVAGNCVPCSGTDWPRLFALFVMQFAVVWFSDITAEPPGGNIESALLFYYIQIVSLFIGNSVNVIEAIGASFHQPLLVLSKTNSCVAPLSPLTLL